jgi:hypothetical protein
MEKVLFVFLLFCLAPDIALSEEVDYYIDNQGYLSRTHGDVDRVSVDHWEVWLYPKGQAPGGRGYWGVIDGKSAAEVMKKLQYAQQFQVRFAKFVGTNPEDEVFTNFNPLGPIAVIGGTPAVTRWAKRVDDTLEQVQTINGMWSMAQRLISDESKPQNPNPEIGRTLKEYLQALVKAEQRALKLRAEIESVIEMPQAEIDRGMAEVNRQFEIAERDRAVVEGYLHVPDSGNIPEMAYDHHYRVNGDGRIPDTSEHLRVSLNGDMLTIVDSAYTSFIYPDDAKFRAAPRNWQWRTSVDLSTLTPDSVSLYQADSGEVRIYTGNPITITGQESWWLPTGEHRRDWLSISYADRASAERAVATLRIIIKRRMLARAAPPKQPHLNLNGMFICTATVNGITTSERCGAKQ